MYCCGENSDIKYGINEVEYHLGALFSVLVLNMLANCHTVMAYITGTLSLISLYIK